MKFTVNGLAESDGEVFKVAPAGNYKLRVVKVEIAETGPNSKYPGSPMIKLVTRILEGDHAGKQIFHNLLMPHEKMTADEYNRAVASVKQVTNAIGLDVSDNGLDTEDLFNAEFTGVVSVETKQGQKDQNRINEFLRNE